MGALDSCQQFGIHWLHRGTIDGLNRPLDLTFIDLLEHIEGRVANLSTRSVLAVGLGRGLGRGVRRRLLRRCRLLIDAVLGEDIVQVRALGRVVDNFQMFFDFATLEDCALASACVQARGTVALSVVSAL